MNYTAIIISLSIGAAHWHTQAMGCQARRDVEQQRTQEIEFLLRSRLCAHEKDIPATLSRVSSQQIISDIKSEIKETMYTSSSSHIQVESLSPQQKIKGINVKFAGGTGNEDDNDYADARFYANDLYIPDIPDKPADGNASIVFIPRSCQDTSPFVRGIHWCIVLDNNICPWSQDTAESLILRFPDQILLAYDKGTPQLWASRSRNRLIMRVKNRHGYQLYIDTTECSFKDETTYPNTRETLNTILIEKTYTEDQRRELGEEVTYILDALFNIKTEGKKAKVKALNEAFDRWMPVAVLCIIGALPAGVAAHFFLPTAYQKTFLTCYGIATGYAAYKGAKSLWGLHAYKSPFKQVPLPPEDPTARAIVTLPPFFERFENLEK